MNATYLPSAWLSTRFDAERQRFLTQHPRSVALAQEAQRHFLFGVPLHWMRDWPSPATLFVRQAEGVQLTCADGLHYTDFCLGDTGAMFGHSPPAVAQAIDAAHARHGYSLHINCHSMPAVASSHATEFPGEAHADFVVGNRDHSTSSPALAELICEHLRALGYSVALNHPYKGVELVRRYSHPASHRHSIQLEINRKLYMDEQTLQTHEGFDVLRAHLRSLVTQLLEISPEAW